MSCASTIKLLVVRVCPQVHYGDKCVEDCGQVSHLTKLELPSEASSGSGGGCLKVVSHDYDDHVLSMELRRRGVLAGLVQDWYDGGVRSS
jgi:hypothetical protein